MDIEKREYHVVELTVSYDAADQKWNYKRYRVYSTIGDICYIQLVRIN